MGLMLLGMAIFFGAHSVRIVAGRWRDRQRARLGPLAWKGAYSVVSLVGLVLMVWGYAETRGGPELWSPPEAMRHVAILLTLPAFVLVVAAYLPRSHFRATLGHPMLAGVKLWALAHLLANGRAGDIVLFGAFLLWSIAAFAAARRRDRIAGGPRKEGSFKGDALALTVGLVAWATFAIVGHIRLIGVAPLG
ncbi:MAG: NnrU family protein [Rhodocyclaceae bacterium]|nr:NnrU family protein [Rhodocyclaceae bacterium]